MHLIRHTKCAECVIEVCTNYLQQLSSQSDVGGWPELTSTKAPTDTDHDVMPDDWEVEMGLNLKDPSDRNRVGADGYTMLEKYLNGI